MKLLDMIKIKILYSFCKKFKIYFYIVTCTFIWGNTLADYNKLRHFLECAVQNGDPGDRGEGDHGQVHGSRQVGAHQPCTLRTNHTTEGLCST